MSIWSTENTHIGECQKVVSMLTTDGSWRHLIHADTISTIWSNILKQQVSSRILVCEIGCRDVDMVSGKHAYR